MTVSTRNKAATSRVPTASTARTTYRHGDLHRALLDAGIELARQGGPDAVVLREATRRAGVAPNAAYRHFANRDDLLGAVRAAAVAAAARSIGARRPSRSRCAAAAPGRLRTCTSSVDIRRAARLCLRPMAGAP